MDQGEGEGEKGKDWGGWKFDGEQGDQGGGGETNSGEGGKAGKPGNVNEKKQIFEPEEKNPKKDENRSSLEAKFNQQMMKGGGNTGANKGANTRTKAKAKTGKKASAKPGLEKVVERTEEEPILS